MAKAKNASEKAKVGRPSKYQPVFAAAVREMSLHGWNDVRIANAFEVDEVTVWRWRRQHPEFGAACLVTDAERVEAMGRSLFHRGMGYSHPSEKIMVVGGEVVRVPTVEHYPPDFQSMRLFLLSKAKGEYSDKTEVEQSGGITVRVEGGLPTDVEGES